MIPLFGKGRPGGGLTAGAKQIPHFQRGTCLARKTDANQDRFCGLWIHRKRGTGQGVVRQVRFVRDIAIIIRLADDIVGARYPQGKTEVPVEGHTLSGRQAVVLVVVAQKAIAAIPGYIRRQVIAHMGVFGRSLSADICHCR